MAHETLTYILRRLYSLPELRSAQDLSDSELLERFRRCREDAAFAVLVQRHGPMVLGVCRRVLNHAQQAEDAFQATFLVLVRKAGSIRKGASLGSWLYGVAQRIALKARAQAARRRTQERQSLPMPRPEPFDQIAWHEFRAVLDEELAGLPEKYRAPVVLCCLEGKTHDQAAQELGCPRTSLSSRLGRARSLLQERLARRGLPLSAGLLATLLGREAVAAGVPPLLTIQTVRAASLSAAGPIAAGVVSSEVLHLAQRVFPTMFLTKVKLITIVLLALAGFGIVTLLPGPAADVGPAAAAPRERSAKPKDGDQPLPDDGLFHDVTARSGLDFTYRNGEEAGHYAILEQIGGGVGLIDFDNDGLLDIFVTGGGTFTGKDKKKIKGRPCKFYRNLGGFKFKDVTKEVGLDRIDFYTHGCAVADFDCDGWPDLLVTGYGGVALFHNEPVDPRDPKKGRKFVDVTKKAGLKTGITWATSAAWGDLDGDGYADLYICQYVNWSMANHPTCDFGGQRDICPPKWFKGLPHLLFRNNGDGTFTDVSKEAGLNVLGKKNRGGGQVEVGKGLGVVMADLNNDGRPDIYVANDTVNKFLYLNRSRPGRIRLEEMGEATGTAMDDNAVPNGSKGIAVGDYSRSGFASLFVTNYEGENPGLYRNEGKEVFTFSTQAAGIAAIGQDYVGCGTGFLDVDNDGWLDLVIINGHMIRHRLRAPIRQLPTLFHNEGGKKFSAITAKGGLYFRTQHLGRGLAIGDLDNDGRSDLVISHLNEPVVVLRNVAGGKARRHHWLGVELVGKKRRDVVGARVIVEAGGKTWTRFATGGGSYLSSGDRRLLFGLGQVKKIERVRVIWPGGKEQVFPAFTVDRYARLVETDK